MTELLEGVEIKLGGEAYIVPPLSLGGLRRCLSAVETIIAGINNPLAPEFLDASLKVIEIAAKRNYPEFDAQALLERLPASAIYDVPAAVMAIVEVSQLIPKTETTATEAETPAA